METIDAWADVRAINGKRGSADFDRCQVRAADDNAVEPDSRSQRQRRKPDAHDTRRIVGMRVGRGGHRAWSQASGDEVLRNCNGSGCASDRKAEGRSRGPEA